MKKAAQPCRSSRPVASSRIPAARAARERLIEQAGLKGTRIGKCEVSDRHANFIVTDVGARSADVLTLIDLIRTTVAEKNGVDLELEIQVW